MKKKISILVFFITAFCSFTLAQKPHFDVQIGTKNLSTNVVTMDQVVMKSQWEAFIVTGNGSPVDLFNFRIESRTNNEGTYYLLLADNQGGQGTTAVELVLVGGVYFEAMIDGGGGSTCTCHGTCTNGCDPKKSGSNWICSNCNVSGSCSKSVTASSNSVFHDDM